MPTMISHSIGMTMQYSRHKRFVRDYIQFYGKSQPKSIPTGQTEIDILQKNHQ